MTNKIYSDYELLELLENDGYETSYRNFVTLKEGIESGDFIINKKDVNDLYLKLSESENSDVNSILEGITACDFESLLEMAQSNNKVMSLLESYLEPFIDDEEIITESKASAAIATAGNAISSGAKTVANKVTNAATTAGSTIASGAKKVGSAFKSAISSVGTAAAANPLKAGLVGGALGIGLVGGGVLLAALIKRLKRKKSEAKARNLAESKEVKEEVSEEAPVEEEKQEETVSQSQIVMTNNNELHIEKDGTIIDKDAEGTISIQLAEDLDAKLARAEQKQEKIASGNVDKRSDIHKRIESGNISPEKGQKLLTRLDNKTRKIGDKVDKLRTQKNGVKFIQYPQESTNESLSTFNTYKASRNMEILLHSYLTEDCGMLEEEYQTLTEETKVESIREIAIQLLKTIEEKVMSVDTTPADRSKGDIKQLKELPAIQDAIGNLETLLDRDSDTVPAAYSEAVNTIIKSILYINQYSQVFKDAYRNKKSVMIMKYESLILSLISSITYLLSTIVSYDSNGVKVKLGADDILNFAPLISLKAFVKSVDSGEFKTVVNDTTIMREYYLEIPVSTMGNILEAYEYIPMIVDGIKNIYSNLASDNGSRLLNILYKVAGIFVLLFSLRDTLYTLFKMKTKVSDMINAIQTFASVNNSGSGILSKLGQFANRFTTDAEFGSDVSKREIEDENRKLFNQVKNIQNDRSMPVVEPKEETETKSTVVPDDGEFGFDF